MSAHGLPCWYELTTHNVKAATQFYGPVIGWSFQDSGMEGFDYTLATANGAMVAGLMDPGIPLPQAWMVYFAVDDCNETAARAAALGGVVHRQPEDIPGTGRFAMLADPQGAVFGILQPTEGQTGTAYDQTREGHGNWHELQSPDPAAALSFYSALLGWRAGQAMDMGPMGTYQMVAAGAGDIGGLMGLSAPNVPPHWLPFFGCNGIEAAIQRIKDHGGTLLHGPQEVPGPAFICYATDPRGGAFALVGPR